MVEIQSVVRVKGILPNRSLSEGEGTPRERDDEGVNLSKPIGKGWGRGSM